MYYGLDKNGNNVYIDDAIVTNIYYCPICNTELVQKKADIKAHHFAHKAKINCPYAHREMSDWHLEWQSHYGRHREILCRSGNEIKIADVLINDTVIEFQHSPISYDEVESRTLFHTGNNRKIIWLFDFREKFSRWSITPATTEDIPNSLWRKYSFSFAELKKLECKNIYYWERPNQSITAICYFNEEEPSYLFFQLADNLIIRVNWNLRKPEVWFGRHSSFEYFAGDKLTKEEFLDTIQRIINE